MLISKELIQKAIKHFPKWMDIRKRYFSSIGGQLLSSVSEEVANMQNAIDEYVEHFFLPFYKDKYESIPDFIYKANIGIVDIKKLELIDPKLEITDNINTFYESSNLAYYQDGFIFVRDYAKKIEYSLEGYKQEAVLEKMHVWNAYDEFAAFVGLKRYNDETNKELFNRITNISKNIINSSEDGLKKSIVANLVNIIPELNIENIKLERPTAENLIKYYDEFNTILDKLGTINKDVLRNKKWDIDKWSNDFKNIDYIPHVWDVMFDDVTNGIGDNDDLKPIFIDSANSTDLEISFYEKSEEYINSYIMDKNIDSTLNLSLLKYNNMLNPYTAKYSITASEATEIATSTGTIPITIELYETLKGEKYRKIDDLIESYSESLKDIEVIKGGLLEEGKYYRVKFYPRSQYERMIISNCSVVDDYGTIVKDDDGNIFDFKSPSGDFILEGNNLVNQLVKVSATNVSDFNVTKNATDTGAGVTIDQIDKEAELILETKNCGGEHLKILYDCDMSNVLENDIELNNFFYDKNKSAYVPDNTGDEKNIIVRVKANQFSMTVNSGQCVTTAIINGEVANLKTNSINGQYQYYTEKFSSPVEMQIEIAAMFNNYVEISELKYSNYSLEVTPKYGSLFKDSTEQDLYWLPQDYENSITIKMKTNTQFAPIIRNVFIGEPLSSSNTFETDLITGMDNVYLTIDSTCTVELYESEEPFAYCNQYDPKQTVISGYSTDKIFRALSDNAQIKLNTSQYTAIESINIPEGTYETSGYGDNQTHIIRLKTGQEISGLTINGHYDSSIAIATIHDLIKNEHIAYEPYVRSDEGFWEYGYKLYANKLLQCFVIEDCYSNQEKVKISIDSFKIDASHKVSKAIIYNLPDSLQGAFTSMDGEDGYTTIGNIHKGTFSNLYVYPKYAKEYIARNEYTTYSHYKENVEIVNTFNNGYIDGSLMVYKIQAYEDSYSTIFDNGKDWSVGKSGITISLNENKNYNLSQKVITENIKLSSTVSLKEVYTAENKEVIELSQYIIDTKNADYDVVYKYDINDVTYDRAEFVTVKNDGFNKLKYSNIIGIKYFGQEIYNEESELNEIDESAYELDKEKGIIIWKDKDIVNSGARLYIIYSIKKAVAIKFHIDSLYEKIQYPVKAYKKIKTYKLEEIENNKKIDLTNPIVGDINLSKEIAENYKKSDSIYVSCSRPGFIAEKIDNTILIKKVAATNSLAIKSGWYYMLGKEYYMFATDQSKNIIEDEYMTSQEVNKIDAELHLHKKTANYIKNSKFNPGTLANSYRIDDFETIKYLKGTSTLNSITACDSYNHWVTFGMDLSLVDGLNGLGLMFNSYTRKDIGYAILDITKYSYEKSFISFYNPNGLNVYIAKEKLINDIPLTDTISIGSMAEVTSKDENNIYHALYTKDKGYKYYLVVRGNGLLDDIIIQEDGNVRLSVHTKNITNLNLKVTENIASGITTRMFFDQEKGNKNNGAEINSSGYIVNASNIDWNVTKIKSYNTEKSWMTDWDMQGVDVIRINDKDCAIATEGQVGKITSKPIYVGEPNTINSIIYKINNIPIKSMNDLNAKLLQAQVNNGAYVACKHKLGANSPMNYCKDLMYPYVKLSVDIPKNKVIDNIEIYIEYKSNDKYAPTERIESNGQFVSKVFDSYHAANYRLKSIEVEDQSDKVSLFIRAAREGSGLSVWTEWKEILIEDGEIKNNIEFENYRFFQVKASLGSKNSKIKLKHFDLEVIN